MLAAAFLITKECNLVDCVHVEHKIISYMTFKLMAVVELDKSMHE